MVRLSSHGETLFVFGLLENARYIDAWVKSRDMGFYAIEYEYFRKGKDRTRGSFNPDFFIRIDMDRYISLLTEEGDRLHRVTESPGSRNRKHHPGGGNQVRR